MKRWTRAAKDFHYSLDTNSGFIDSQLRNSVVYVNALEVVTSAEKDAEASEILMNHLSIAKKEIQRLMDEECREHFVFRVLFCLKILKA